MQILIQYFGGGARGSAFLTNSRVTSLLRVWEAHFGEYKLGIAEMSALTSVKMPQDHGKAEENMMQILSTMREIQSTVKISKKGETTFGMGGNVHGEGGT